MLSIEQFTFICFSRTSWYRMVRRSASSHLTPVINIDYPANNLTIFVLAKIGEHVMLRRRMSVHDNFDRSGVAEFCVRNRWWTMACLASREVGLDCDCRLRPLRDVAASYGIGIMDGYVCFYFVIKMRVTRPS